MAAILKNNGEQPGSGLVVGANPTTNTNSQINAYDSGLIVTVGTSGKPPQKLTVGSQQQATVLVSAPGSNFIVNPQVLGGNTGDQAAISNVTITSSFVNGVPVVVVTCSTGLAAGNDFIVNQSVKLSFSAALVAANLGLQYINQLVGVVQSVTAGSPNTAFVCNITNFVPIISATFPNGLPQLGSTATTGSTATVNYQAKTACLSLSSETD